jgi:hypothetical protein
LVIALPLVGCGFQRQIPLLIFPLQCDEFPATAQSPPSPTATGKRRRKISLPFPAPRAMQTANESLILLLPEIRRLSAVIQRLLRAIRRLSAIGEKPLKKSPDRSELTVKPSS